MSNNKLINTNPYLKDPIKRKELIKRSVRTSSGVEGIEIKDNDSNSNSNDLPVIIYRKGYKIYKLR